LRATGRKDFLWRFMVHLGGMSHAPNVQLCLTSTAGSVWETLTNMAHHLDRIRLSETAFRESSSTPATRPDFRMSLLSLLASITLNLLPELITANRRALAHTDL